MTGIFTGLLIIRFVMMEFMGKICTKIRAFLCADFININKNQKD